MAVAVIFTVTFVISVVMAVTVVIPVVPVLTLALIFPVIMAVALTVALIVALVITLVGLVIAFTIVVTLHTVVTIAWLDEDMCDFFRGDDHQPFGIGYRSAVDLDAVAHFGALGCIVRASERNRSAPDDQGLAINFGDTAVDAVADRRIRTRYAVHCLQHRSQRRVIALRAGLRRCAVGF